MRLFIAVDVDRATREAARQLRATIGAAHPAVERALRWIDPPNLHLTLRFLGEQEPDPIEQVLAAPFAQPRFSLQWTTPAWLPSSERARIFHVAVGAGSEDLHRLVEEVTRRLLIVGIPAEERAFTAHLTLARVRDSAEPGIARQIAAYMPVEPFLPGRRVSIEAMTLYESRLSSQGPTYHVRQQRELS